MEAGCTYGWRISELLKLKVNQVDFAHKVIRLHPGTTKNKDGREVSMTEAVRNFFTLCVEGKGPQDYLFTRPNGKRVRDFVVHGRRRAQRLERHICSSTTCAALPPETSGGPELRKASS